MFPVLNVPSACKPIPNFDKFPCSVNTSAILVGMFPLFSILQEVLVVFKSETAAIILVLFALLMYFATCGIANVAIIAIIAMLFDGAGGRFDCNYRIC